MVSSKPPFDSVTALMQAGRLAEAERLCRQGLAAKAPQPERFHYALGHIFISRRELDKAAAALQEAVRLAPLFAEALHALAFVFKDLGDPERAIRALARAADCPGAGAGIHCNLGLMRSERGENRLAIEALRRAVTVDPRMGAAWQALGTAYRAINEIEEAIAAFRRAVECDARNPATHRALGTFLLDLEREGAVEALATAASLAPQSATAAELHARALARAARFEDAFLEHERARALAPESGACILSHARSLGEAGRPEEADALCREVIASPRASPDDRAVAHHEMAIRALADGNVSAARADLDAAMALAPARDEIRLRRAMLLLSLGLFEPGWKEFEARFGRTAETGGIRAQPFPQPRWRGQDLGDRTILVWGEQGIGDDIVAASMLPDLSARVRTVLVHTDPRLQPLFARSFPANVVFFPRVLPVQPELLSGDVSCQVPFGGLGEFLRPSWESFGAPRAYLHADPAKVEYFRRRYVALPGLRIGISWRSRNLVNGRVKSTDLGVWGPILRTPGVTFVNLQYGDCAADITRARALFGCHIHHDPEVDQLRDMDAFAAQVASLDGVISVSNAIAHTAGAVGLPTCVLLATDPLWLWFRGRADSPWYPRVRLFRQARPGGWSEPVAGVAAALEAWTHDPGRPFDRTSTQLGGSYKPPRLIS